jgi:hypothetical protein
VPNEYKTRCIVTLATGQDRADTGVFIRAGGM